MTQTVVGLFDRFDEARSAVDALTDAGFSRSEISLVANDASRSYEKHYGAGAKSDKMDDTTAEQAGSGAVAGTAAGAGIGLLVGLGALAIPGIGPIIAAGPLAAALGAGAATVAGATAIGAGVGAVSGALIGPLVDAGIPRPEAEIYTEGVRRGGALVTVRTDDRAAAERASEVLGRFSVVDIDRRGEEYRQSGWAYSDSAQPYTESEIAGFRSGSDALNERAIGGSYDAYDTDFRSHYQSTYASSGMSYDSYSPVYRYGYSLASDDTYRDRDWNAIEADVRTRWEERNPGTWEQFKDGVRYAWDKVRGAR